MSSNDQLTQNKIINSFKTIEEIWDELYPTEQVRIVNLLVKNVTIKSNRMEIGIFESGLRSLAHEFTN